MSNIIHITRADDLSISNNQLVMIDEDDNNKIDRISLNDVMAVVIENCKCRITGVLQLKLVENNIPLIICNEKHQPALHSMGLYNHFQVTTRINEQIKWSEKKKEEIWSEIVIKKIENQRELLKFLEKSETAINRLSMYIDNIRLKKTDAEHQEAIASRIYFQELFGNSFKRFSDDGVNSALNYGYMILRTLISSKIVGKGFHPSLGIHHKSQFNSYNLSDDIIEIFRPMVDFVVYFNKTEEIRLSKELRQKLLTVLKQKVYWKDKKYDLSQVIDYFIDNIRNYFVDESVEAEIPDVRIEDYEY
ncbi:type II CRISPR-associated endonuclease Cas1 [Leptotrichia sp. OH3620_COT-345]|uniref:type II CRISPR-associated endonuclease Cas1 n=1 Tax=Leptotrichia sp. OH3620_COT-345 TaxID=2491048 RepID=UPI000F64D8D5|nr:type II CRISPR-associated endonuclease Cas1 [Leptotrichia sp. OH3620_COT-345]RRD39664.1 type II CRISPR-associated endonuclease Cas1 [Leptotrichia sp. OH3620_COT-345]